MNVDLRIKKNNPNAILYQFHINRLQATHEVTEDSKKIYILLSQRLCLSKIKVSQIEIVLIRLNSKEIHVFQ